MSEIKKGMMLQDRYVLGDALGKGASATVFLARDIRMQREVAAKVFNPAKNPDRVAIEHEAETQMHLQPHEHILPVYGYNVGAEHPYIILMHARQGSLADSIRQGSRLSVDKVVKHVLEAASGIHHMHKRGVVHRDVKPSNLLLDNDRTWVTDLGIAVKAHGEDSDMTEQLARGSLAYIAPEQIYGKGRPSSDLYSLGIVTFELLTGVKPFQADTNEGYIAEHLTGTPLTFAEALKTTVPAEIAAFVGPTMKAFSRDPSERQGDVRQFAQEILAAYGEKSTVVIDLKAKQKKSGDKTESIVLDPTLVFPWVSLENQRAQMLGDIAQRRAEQEQGFHQREQALDVREADVAQREAVVTQREHDLDLREEKVVKRINDVEGRNGIEAKLIEAEKIAWEEVLGAEVDVEPLPSYVTPEVIDKLEMLGLELRYIPALSLGIIDDLQRQGAEKYMEGLEQRYSQWRRAYKLNDEEITDRRISRQPGLLFWNSILDGNTEFPQFGYWMAVEMVETPKSGYNSGGPYRRTPVVDMIFNDIAMGILDPEGDIPISKTCFLRGKFSWEQIHAAIDLNKDSILSQVGLDNKPVTLGLPELLPWNLLGNRHSWGETVTMEWTDTPVSTDEGLSHFMIGEKTNVFDRGGTAMVYTINDQRISDHGGFRIAIKLH